MKHRGIKLLSLFAILALALGVTGAAFAAPPATQEVCPEGDGWSEHQDPESFGSVEGADNYCVKGGSSNSEGCTGYLEIGSFEYVSGFVGAEGYCGLSHWGYFMGEEEPDPASVSVDPGSCYWDGASYTDVTVDMTGEGTLTISGPGGPYVRTGDDTLTLTPGSYSWTFVPAEGFELEGPGSGDFTVGECQPETDPASVSVELGSCRWDEQSGSQTPFSFDISGEGTFSINGSDYTSDGEILLPPGTYGWTFVPAEGYHLVGSGSGSVEVLACEPPAPGEAAATVVPYCGGGVNVTLANAVVFVQHADEDPLIIEENGNYPLELGDYDAWAEALEGYEFPDGATTKWEFTIELCPSGHEEPPTGPLDSIPLSAALPIAGSATLGLALLGSAIRRKRQ